MGALGQIHKYTVDLTAIPEYGGHFKGKKDATWTFYLRNSIACIASLLMNPNVVGENGEFMDFNGAAENEFSGCRRLQKQRAVRGLHESQRTVSLHYFIDAAAVGKSGRLSYKPLMVTCGELRRHARQRDDGAELVG
jgi:hypothetical protein